MPNWYFNMFNKRQQKGRKWYDCSSMGQQAAHCWDTAVALLEVSGLDTADIVSGDRPVVATAE
jgi:hypothetical protein